MKKEVDPFMEPLKIDRKKEQKSSRQTFKIRDFEWKVTPMRYRHNFVKHLPRVIDILK